MICIVLDNMNDTTGRMHCVCVFVTSFGNAAVDEMSILAPLKQCKQYVYWIRYKNTLYIYRICDYMYMFSGFVVYVVAPIS